MVRSTGRNGHGGGCGLIYDRDIAETLCTPSELRKTKNGERNPNSREQWLDVQARAAFQGWLMIKSAIDAIKRKQTTKLTATKVIFEDYTEQEEQARKTA